MSLRTAFAFICLVAAAWPSMGQSSAHEHHHVAPLAAGAATLGAAPPTGAKPLWVRFPARLRDHTLSNMRDHLLALAEIQDHLGRQQYDIAADIAEQRLGMSSLKLHGAHEVAGYMPPGMQQAGSAMHHAASRFALTAQESAIDRDMGKSVAALTVLTQACVACHAGYRLR